MKLNMCLLMLVAGIGLAGCGESKEVKDLRAQVEEAQSTADDAKQKADDLEDKVSDLEDRIDTLESNSPGE